MIEMKLRENGTLAVRTVNLEPSKADPQFKDDCDVNKILKKYTKTGVWPGVPRGQYLDLSDVGDYHQMVNTVKAADAQFMSLDAQIRRRFDNDPGKLLAFLDDPNNYDEAVKMGLVSPRSPQSADNGSGSHSKLAENSDHANVSNAG